MFYSQLLVALHVVKAYISFNVLYHKSEKSGVLFGCTFKNQIRFWELANLNYA